jgi:hypothetical protein
VRQMLRVAARAGSLTMLKWMWFRYPAIITNDDVPYLLDLAARAGALDLCQFLPTRVNYMMELHHIDARCFLWSS